jgi:hypothetical protein
MSNHLKFKKFVGVVRDVMKSFGHFEKQESEEKTEGPERDASRSSPERGQPPSETDV